MTGATSLHLSTAEVPGETRHGRSSGCPQLALPPGASSASGTVRRSPRGDSIPPSARATGHPRGLRSALEVATELIRRLEGSSRSGHGRRREHAVGRAGRRARQIDRRRQGRFSVDRMQGRPPDSHASWCPACACHSRIRTSCISSSTSAPRNWYFQHTRRTTPPNRSSTRSRAGESESAPSYAAGRGRQMAGAAPTPRCGLTPTADFDDSLGKGLRGFLGKVVPDATLDDPVRVLA